jgi:branched-chain amino acid transport system ATP-binding protein
MPEMAQVPRDAQVRLLEIKDLVSGYGEAVVVDGISLELQAGQSMAIIGRNGVGKTTLLNSIIGVTMRRRGEIWLGGRNITALPAERRAHAGIGWVPQERNILRSLTVEENLVTTARPGPWTLERAYEMFPRLKERRRNLGGQLSGGEQQMLAIGRALLLNPQLVLLDEPTEGLAPIIIDELMQTLQRLVQDGLSMLIVEQHAQRLLGLTHKAAILERGRVVWHGDADVLARDQATLQKYLGVVAR